MEDELFGVCPFATAQRLLQGKWAILIMHHLEAGPVRFNELQRRMPKMTHATLARQLRQLQEEGLVERAEYEGAVQRVEYSLTPIGQRFSPVLAEIREWGMAYIGQIQAG